MGQKSNPIGLRLGINRTWDSIWFDDKNFSDRCLNRIKLISSEITTAAEAAEAAEATEADADTTDAA